MIPHALVYLIYSSTNFVYLLTFLGLNIFLVLIFVMFVADGHHFDRMFKMILIFAIRVLFDLFM